MEMRTSLISDSSPAKAVLRNGEDSYLEDSGVKRASARGRVKRQERREE